MRGTHLHDGNLVLWAQTEQCLWHTDIVVEVSLGVHDVEFLGEDGGDELLRCGLAVGAGDANDGMLNWRRCSRASSLKATRVSSTRI